MQDSLPGLIRLLLVAIPLAAFATGLRVSEPFWLWKRPRLLARSLLAVLVVVPVVDIALVTLLRPEPVVRAGIVVSILSIGIGPPQAFKRTAAAGARVAYEVGLDIALLLLAIVYVPVAVALHGAIFHHAVRLQPGDVAQVVLAKMLIPLLLGIVFARLAPRFVDRVGRVAGLFVNVALLIVIVLLLLVTWRGLVGLGLAAWLTCAVVAASSIAIGHLFGQGERELRPALVAFSTLRFPALALVIVAAVPRGERLIPVVLAYVLTSLVLLAAYGAVNRARGRRMRPAPPLGAATSSPGHRG